MNGGASYQIKTYTRGVLYGDAPAAPRDERNRDRIEWSTQSVGDDGTSRESSFKAGAIA